MKTVRFRNALPDSTATALPGRSASAVGARAATTKRAASSNRTTVSSAPVNEDSADAIAKFKVKQEII